MRADNNLCQLESRRKPVFQLANLQYPNFTELTDLEQLKVIFPSEDLLKTATFCL